MKLLKNKIALKIAAASAAFFLWCIAAAWMVGARAAETVRAESEVRAEILHLLSSLLVDIADLREDWLDVFERTGNFGLDAWTAKFHLLDTLENGAELLREQVAAIPVPGVRFTARKARRSLRALHQLRPRAEEIASSVRAQQNDLKNIGSWFPR